MWAPEPGCNITHYRGILVLFSYCCFWIQDKFEFRAESPWLSSWNLVSNRLVIPQELPLGSIFQEANVSRDFLLIFCYCHKPWLPFLIQGTQGLGTWCWHWHRPSGEERESSQQSLSPTGYMVGTTNLVGGCNLLSFPSLVPFSESWFMCFMRKGVG